MTELVPTGGVVPGLGDQFATSQFGVGGKLDKKRGLAVEIIGITGQRRRQVEAELADVEDWLAQATEALEAARAAGDEGEVLVLEAECGEAREQLDELLAEWELLT